MNVIHSRRSAPQDMLNCTDFSILVGVCYEWHVVGQNNAFETRTMVMHRSTDVM